MNKKNVIKFLIYFGFCECAGAIGSIFTVSAIKNWYVFLEKPSFSPPNWLFGPAWTTLYLLMAISIFLISSSYAKATEGQSKKIKMVSRLFWIHLFFNAIWSFLFFGLESPLLGLFDIIILWVMIGILTFQFFKIRKLAGILFIPYWLWVSFATILNFFVWKLN
ncbi:MAG: tryptophan-rich sensory protein [Patescibacteria group bacterium]|nr:tryptophan-rich sensory protein [Patescibacteria group bacterium]MDD5164274.1 tryptophan-rich sensory protein [Patescibacteria group bacterium]MDD5535045.1 tryptophan-rich sensory protein [Patescibacteria group bacterium]